MALIPLAWVDRVRFLYVAFVEPANWLGAGRVITLPRAVINAMLRARGTQPSLFRDPMAEPFQRWLATLTEPEPGIRFQNLLDREASDQRHGFHTMSDLLSFLNYGSGSSLAEVYEEACRLVQERVEARMRRTRARVEESE